MGKLSNQQVNSYVNNLKPFETNSSSMFSTGGRDTGLYAVYSYGFHFPMYVYDTASKQWFGNHDKYSRTTSAHQSYAQPRAKIHWMDTHDMKLLTAAGSLAGRCANRMKGEAA